MSPKTVANFLVALSLFSAPVAPAELHFEGVVRAAERLGLRSLLYCCDTTEVDLRSKKTALASSAFAANVLRLEDVGERDFKGGSVAFCAHQYSRETLVSFLNQHLDFSVDYPWILFYQNSSMSASVRDQLDLKIDHQLYFVHLDSQTMVEHYVIGGAPVKRILPLDTLSVGTFVERRSESFNGANLKAITNTQGSYVRLDDDRIRQGEEGWIKDRAGGSIKSIEGQKIIGIFYEMLKILESDMNFTTTLMLRRDRRWGSPQANGSWDGMVSNVLNEDVDFIATSLTQNIPRSRVLDFLHAMGKETQCIYISVKDWEEHDWFSFFFPLSKAVWMAMLFVILITLIVVRLLQHLRSCENKAATSKPFHKFLLYTILDFWSLSRAYFGGVPKLHENRTWPSENIILFTTSLAGLLVFISYRSSLTAELAVKRTNLPFDTLDGLYNSDYK